MNSRHRPTILQVVVQTPLRGQFDYRYQAKETEAVPAAGCRVIVPFGPRSRLGIVVGHSEHSDISDDKLKTIKEVVDHQPVLNQQLMQLACWSSRYYHHSLGDICFTMLPQKLRQPHPFELPMIKVWTLTQSGQQAEVATNATKQKQCLELLQASPAGLDDAAMKSAGVVTNTLKRLTELGFIDSNKQLLTTDQSSSSEPAPTLTNEQQLAVDAVNADRFQVYLLNGITGSGKTEVYLRLIQHQLDAGKQALVLVPEIGLTPQTVNRFRRRLNYPVRVLHSNLNESEQYSAWALASQPVPQVVIATRSGLFAPLPKLGIIIVDEEHDSSYKQQSGWFYSARDLAVVRGQQANLPVILGSATPGLESYYRAEQNQYTELMLQERPLQLTEAVCELLDIRKLPLQQGLSRPLLERISTTLKRGEQVLVFLNRRGYAPVLMCHDCGWLASCERCHSQFTLHRKNNQLMCHHCEARRPIPAQCPDCHSGQVTAVGQGTERIEETLHQHFPDYALLRIDRDSTRQKGQMAAHLEKIRNGQAQLVVGTQMLAKGHHFPNLSLVVIVDMDGALYCSDFRATERFGQLFKQVSGRAGRADKAGRILLQTRQPDHPHLKLLINSTYAEFCRQLLKDRKATHWPPFSHLILLRAEATDEPRLVRFLSDLRQQLKDIAQTSQVQLLGPVPALLQKKAGKFRYQLLLQSEHRASLHQFTDQMIELIAKQKLAKSVRWTLDVDPLDLV